MKNRITKWLNKEGIMEIPKLGDRVSVWIEGRVSEIRDYPGYGKDNIRVQVDGVEPKAMCFVSLECIEPKEVGDGVTT